MKATFSVCLNDSPALRTFELCYAEGMQGSNATTPKLATDDRLTAADARKLRHSIGQAQQGKTRPWREIKRELGL
jgi:hypothetical protein